MSINAELDLITKLKVEPLHSASSTSGKDNKMFSKSMRLVGLFSTYINSVEFLVYSLGYFGRMRKGFLEIETIS